jgi:DmsE family decaheme c-type cytochrome
MRKKIFLINTISLVCLVLLVLLVLTRSEMKTEGAEKSEETIPCETCHADRVAEFTLNPHAVLDTKELAKKAGAEYSCASCHTDSEAHLKDPGKGTNFAFKTTDLAKTKTQVCQTCHRNTHPQFFASPHAKAGMDCTSCHSIHSGNPARSLLETENSSETCRSCHAEAFAKFDLNEHHRLKEGILECTTCHNPHESQTRARLAGFKQAACLKCHTDKQGPYVFEHGSVLVEGCVACHEPHGSVNRHMLTYQKVANLCFSCHAVAPSFHSRFTADTDCTSCHSAIHGSNNSPVFLNF